MNKDEITCRFTDHKVRKENYFPYFKYTLYDIKVEYKDLSWTIHRRYNEFLVLHNKLKTLIINIPFMPIKCLFAKRKKVIDERILFLENYLNSVLKILNEQVFENIYEDLFNFLCLDNIENHSKLGEIENMTTSENSFEISSSFMTPYFRASIEINGISYNSIIISNFFEKLINEKQDSYLICYDFQVILEKNWFQLTRDNVYYLFYGDNLNKGLIFHSGNINKNPASAKDCLLLLSKILTHENNNNCDFYINVLKQGKKEQIEDLNEYEYFNLKLFEYLQEFYKIKKLYGSGKDKIY